MKIAIVDDQTEERTGIRRQLEAELSERGIPAELTEYDCGEAFLDAYEPGKFSVVFLDIYMKKITGIEVAGYLYQHDPACKIIFLTSSEEYLRESYSVRATYYLVKPYEPKQLHQALDFCFPAPKPEDILAVRSRGGMMAIPRRDILYIEASGRHPHIHLATRSIECIDSFSEVIRPLENDRRFFSCCRGIIVHLGKIATQQDNDFVMENGQLVPISRRLKPEALRAFHTFMFRSVKEDAQ